MSEILDLVLILVVILVALGSSICLAIEIRRSILIKKEICPYCRGQLTTVNEGEQTRGSGMGSFTGENLRTYCLSCNKTISEKCVGGYWHY